MTLEIYHQFGHNHNWNIDSINTDNSGDGIILSPKHMAPRSVERLNFPKQKSIFDPQFFLPSSAFRNLSEYPFYPCIAIEGFSTSSYRPSDVKEIANGCVNYQIENEFEYLVIPARSFGNNPTEYINEQNKCFIDPFLSSLSNYSFQQKIILQVVLKSSFLLDESYFDEILNWITSLQDIDGVYLLIESAFKTKQIEDINYLYSLMRFINILEEYNELKVIVGYCNLESYVLSISGPSIVTIGSYENTRQFNISNFEEKEEDKKNFRGPNARYYFSKLLQLVDNRYLDSIAVEYGYDLFDLNDYHAHMFVPSYKWHFTKPEPYKHFFKVFSEQLRLLSPLQLNERYIEVKKNIESAIQFYEDLSDLIVFSKDSRGDHLPMWLTAANRFAHYKGWI